MMNHWHKVALTGTIIKSGNALTYGITGQRPLLIWSRMVFF